MENLKQYGEQELSLRVFNEEYFYFERNDRAYLMALINEEFHYTPEQMAELIVDLDDDADNALLAELGA
jgi:hypothetical protein